MNRVFKFLVETRFSSHQIDMVPFFKRYRINDFDTNRFVDGPFRSSKAAGVDTERVYSFDKFEPDKSDLDRMLMKLMLGREREDETDAA